MKIRCNNCMKVFLESDVFHDDNGNEYCPYCFEHGTLIDLEDKEDG